jgi:hypothetical protein
LRGLALSFEGFIRASRRRACIRVLRIANPQKDNSRMTRKMTTKNEQENDQKNEQENDQKNEQENDQKNGQENARAISRRKQLETARPCKLARELIDDPIRIVALSERRESKGLSRFPGRRGLSAAAGG